MTLVDDPVRSADPAPRRPRSGTPIAVAALVAAVVVAVGRCRCSSASADVLARGAVRPRRSAARGRPGPGSSGPCSALAVGAALGLAGACLQGLTRNPLADPGILGINAGACLRDGAGASRCSASPSLSAYVWFAFLGAAVAAVVVHLVASLGREGATPVKLAIAGAAVTAAVTQLDVRRCC